MSANYFNLGGRAVSTVAKSSILTIDDDSPWEVLQAGGIGGGVSAYGPPIIMSTNWIAEQAKLNSR